MDNDDILHTALIKIRSFSNTLALYTNQFFVSDTPGQGITCHELKSIKPSNLNHSYSLVKYYWILKLSFFRSIIQTHFTFKH